MRTVIDLIFNMKHLVIGLGEVGSALQKVLECDGYDMGDTNDEYYDVIHICFPYSDGFINQVEEYRTKFDAKYVVVHSTVKVGTCLKLNATHSMIRGVHPMLEESIRTFVKYFGGEEAEVMAHEFTLKGIKTDITPKSETVELMKLVDTTSYGINILIEKEIYRLCEEYSVPFETVYSDANLTYNKGYSDMGMPQFQKYNLKHFPGKIGGHCINENAELLDTWMNNLIKNKNATL